jgi:hypothetical protein
MKIHNILKESTWNGHIPKSETSSPIHTTPDATPRLTIFPDKALTPKRLLLSLLCGRGVHLGSLHHVNKTSKHLYTLHYLLTNGKEVKN